MRLIDADVMINNLTAMKSQYDAIDLDGMIRGLKEQSTAYDVDKVVERLEEAMNDANMRSGDYEDYDDYEQGRATAFEESIDIVKQNLTD